MIGILGHSFHTATRTAPRSTRTPVEFPDIQMINATLRQRRALANLDYRLLDDIGLTREEADTEVKRPFWDAPGWFRRGK